MMSLDSFFQFTQSFLRTMTLGFAEPLTETSTRNLPGGKALPERRVDNLNAICEPTICLTNLRASRAC
jgi:hypothetical protein